MDEARRFLRYVTPGLAFGVQTMALLFVLSPVWTWVQIKSLKDDQGAGLAVVVFLASGGLGYLFSVVHHTLHALDLGPNWSAVDHRPLLLRLTKSKMLRILQIADDGALVDLPAAKLTRGGAWIILTAAWRERSQTRAGIKSADSATSAFMDLVHSAGATRVAALAAVIGAASVGVLHGVRSTEWPTPFQWFGALALGASLVALHHFNYLRLGKRAQATVDQVFSDSIRSETQPGKPPAETIVGDIEALT